MTKAAVLFVFLLLLGVIVASPFIQQDDASMEENHIDLLARVSFKKIIIENQEVSILISFLFLAPKYKQKHAT